VPAGRLTGPSRNSPFSGRSPVAIVRSFRP
jgi:hypothetical protein